MSSTKLLLSLGLFSLVFAGCRRKDSYHVSPKNSESEKASQPTTAFSSIPQPDTHPQATLKEEKQEIAQSRARIIREINQLIHPPASGFGSKDWKVVKDSYWMSSFDEVIEQNSAISDVRGLLATPEDKVSLIKQLLTGRFTDVSDKSEQDAILAFHILALATAPVGGASLPAAFEGRVNDSKITRGDVILFEVFSDALLDAPYSKQSSELDVETWNRLAVSPNSLIRLLALRTFRRVTPSPEQWLEFYRNYSVERDQGIMEEVADLVFLNATPEAAVLLVEIRNTASQSMSAEFVSKLNRSIDFLRNIPVRDQ